MSNLLQEALLDINQVKDVAEKNAKNVVLETLMPKIKDFIEEKLIEGDSLVEDRKTEPADPAGGAGVIQGDVIEDDDEVDEDDISKIEVEVEIDEGVDSPFDGKVKKVDLDGVALALKENENNKKTTGKSQNSDIVNISLNNESIGGESIMSDLYRLLENEGDDLEEGVPEEEVEEGAEPEVAPEPEEGGAVSEAELDELLAELEAEEGVYEGEGDEDLDEWVEIDERELAEALRELEEGADSPFDTKVKSVDLDGIALALKEENGTLKSRLRKMNSVVTKLGKQLEESNLFNAKLLYANRLLNNKNLTKEEKVTIIETLDEAKSLREVKLVYNTFVKTSTKANAKAYVNESAVRSALPGGSSRAASSGASTQKLNESADLTRWKKLAGLT